MNDSQITPQGAYITLPKTTLQKNSPVLSELETACGGNRHLWENIKQAKGNEYNQYKSTFGYQRHSCTCEKILNRPKEMNAINTKVLLDTNFILVLVGKY